MTAITCEVQYVHFAWDDRLEEGPLSLEEAIDRFRFFPFAEQLIEARRLPDPTFPTLTFRAATGDSFAIWCASPRAYDVMGEVHGRRWSARINDRGAVEQLICAFFVGEWNETIAHFAHAGRDVDGDDLGLNAHTIPAREKVWIIGGALVMGLLSLSQLAALFLAGLAPYVREGVAERFGGRTWLSTGFLTLAAVALGYQWVRGWAAGYMYYSVSERIHVHESRILFTLMAVAQALVVILFGALAAVIVSG